jgi:uncharacterized membrane protein
MNKNRMEAFSDGVIAILITIMVLELRIPEGADWTALRSILPVFSTYVLSFIYLGIYWNNHHHMLQAVEHVNGKVLWANLHLLFWLSLVPFVTGWMGHNHFATLPTAMYGLVMFLSGVAYIILEYALIGVEGPQSDLAKAVGKDPREQISAVLLAASIPLAFVNRWISGGIYVFVVLMWIIPDPRIESRLKS